MKRRRSAEFPIAWLMVFGLACGTVSDQPDGGPADAMPTTDGGSIPDSTSIPDAPILFDAAPGTISVVLGGVGTGSVVSSPAGIDCPGTCSASFAAGTMVSLTAAPGADSSFAGWSGACSGSSTTCPLMADSGAVVNAAFDRLPVTLTVIKTGAGGGTITSSPAGINCGATCNAAFDYDTMVTLTATPDGNSSFTGWSGPCTGMATCEVLMQDATSVSASFAQLPIGLSVSVGGDGTGSVTSSPSGISCPGTCNATFPVGTSVTLTATAADGSLFSSWGGACAGSGTCQLTLNSGTSASATFNRETIACNWSGSARWLSHGWDGGNMSATGAWVSCVNSVVSDMSWQANAGTGVNPSPSGTANVTVGCNWSGNKWAAQGWDSGQAFTHGSTVTCSGNRVTAMNWESNTDPTSAPAAKAGHLACNWNGAVFLTHGWDGGCAFQTGFEVTCNSNQITHFKWVEGCAAGR